MFTKTKTLVVIAALLIGTVGTVHAAPAVVQASPGTGTLAIPWFGSWWPSRV